MTLLNAITSKVIRDLTWGRIKTKYTVHSWHDKTIISPTVFFHGLYKNWEIESRNYFASHIKSGDVVLDIGASNGLYTILFSDLVGDNGRVYAFEPDSRLYVLLKENMKRNGIKNVILYKNAVSDFNGKTKFYLSSMGMSSLQPMQGLRSKMDVDVITVDSLELERVDWLKIDTEGTEHLILDGAIQTLERCSPKMLIEFLPQFGNADLLLSRLEGWRITGLDHNILCERR